MYKNTENDWTAANIPIRYMFSPKCGFLEYFVL